MTAKEFLGQAYRLEQSVSAKLEQVESIHALTQKVSGAMGGVRVSHSRNVTSLEDSIIRLMEAEEELNCEIDKLIDLKLRISNVIKQVHNVDYQLILEKRYMCYLSWNRIATDMQITRRWALTLHSRAVDVVDKLLKKPAA